MSRSLAQFSQDLRQLPRVVAHKVAERAAPVLTSLVRETFAAGANAYGDPWEPGDHGDKITLDKTGALKQGLVYVAIGTKLRLKLPVPYAKYQVGKRPVAPTQGGALPVEYTRALERTATAVIKEELHQ